MGTTDTFDSPNATSVALADQFPIKSSLTGVAATATVGQALSGSAGVVNTTASALALTQALHGNRAVTIASATPIAVTLPAATGTGTKYRLVVMVAATATQHTIKIGTTAEVFQGVVVSRSTTTTIVAFGATATDNTLTLNGSTTGGVAGDEYELTDVKTGVWQLRAVASPTGAAATPLSHT
jgi:hypothetical protein